MSLICRLGIVCTIVGTFFFSNAALATKSTKHPQVVFETTKGKIVVELFEDKAPLSAKNILDYVDAGFYDGTVFHRIIKDFMIQGGGMLPTLQRKDTRAPIKNEATNGLKNKRGTLALARTGVVDSATSQFFINLVDNPHLDHRSPDPSGYGYAVFGRVIEGMDVVDAMAKVDTHCSSRNRSPCTEASLPPGMRDVPKEPIVITKASRR